MKFWIGIVVITLIILGGGVYLYATGKPAPDRAQLGTASMKIDKKSEDFGSMKVTDERRATFTITNTGTSVLRIWNVATSCDCTSATVIIGDKTTAEFNMKGMMSSDLSNWIGEVPAGKNAVLTVIYRPSKMPVNGPVTRQTTFSTNDPNNSDVEVSIAANVL